MQAFPILVSAVLLSCGGSYALIKLTEPDRPPADLAAPVSSADFDQLRQDLADSKAALADLHKRLDSVGSGPRSVAPAARRGEIEAIVKELLAAHGAAPADAAGAKPELEYQNALTKLDATTSWEEGEALWKEIHAAGLTDQIVAEFERRAAANPQNADLQAALGSALIQQIASAPTVGEQGDLALKADSAFDKALELNPSHWEARFVKATSYAFWPPALGKQPEAISHFETLVEQQEASSRSEPHHAQTYIFLGNLYAQTGKDDKAKELWRRGAQRFPKNDELRDKSK